MDTAKLALTVIVRYLIVAACAWLIKHGVMTQGDAQAFQDPTVITAIVVGLVTIGAAMYVRVRSRYNTNVALKLPANATKQDVDAVTSNAPLSEVISTKPTKQTLRTL